MTATKLAVGERFAPPAEMRRQMRRMVIERDALATRETGDDRIPICISSEEPYERWWGVEVLGHAADEIDMQYCDFGLAFCADHDVTKQVGVVEDISLDKDRKLRGMVRMGSHPDAEWIKKDILAGIRTGISVGYAIDELELVEAEGDPDGDGDMDATYRVTRWTPMEASTVAVPADTTVGVGRDATQGARMLARHIPGAARNGHGDKMTDKDKGAAAAGAPTGPTPEQVREQAIAAEEQRIASIRALADENGLAEHLPELFALSFEKASRRMLELARAKHAPTAPVISVGADRAVEKPFANPGEFFRAVVNHGRGKGFDERLKRAAAGMGESIGSEGGFAVPVEVMTTLLERITGPQGGEILRRVNEIPITTGNGTKIPGIDETSRANGSRWGGISVAYVGEGDTIGTSKPKVRQIDVNLKKLVGAVILTDELLEDSPMANVIVEQGFTEEFTFVIEDNVVNGLGAGTPLGIMASNALVTVSKESGQVTGTLNVANVTKMFARFGGRWARAVWLIDQSVMPQLQQMTIGQMPVWMPPGGLTAAPYGSLFGAPTVFTEYNAQLSSLGDIILADLGYYAFAVKGGLRSANSMHVRFLTDEQVLRWTHRHDGQPIVNAALTPKNGGPTRSPFVTLQAR